MTSGPLITLDTSQGEVSIFTNSTFTNLEQLATYLQLRINDAEKLDEKRDLVGLSNGQLVIIGPNQQLVNLANASISTTELQGPPGNRGPAGPTGDVSALYRILIVLVIVIAIVGIMIAFGRYLHHLDVESADLKLGNPRRH